MLTTSFQPINVSAADANIFEVITLVGSFCGTPKVRDPTCPKVLCVRPAVSASNALIVDLAVTVNTPSKIFVVYENPQTGRLRTKTTTAADTVLPNGGTERSTYRPLCRLIPQRARPKDSIDYGHLARHRLAANA